MEMRVRDCGDFVLAKRLKILDNIQESNRSLRALRQAQCKLREAISRILVEIATLRLPLRYAQGSGSGQAVGLRPPRNDGFNKSLTSQCYNSTLGDDWLRRLRLDPNCEPRGADLVKPAQNSSAKSTEYAALPLAA